MAKPSSPTYSPSFTSTSTDTTNSTLSNMTSPLQSPLSPGGHSRQYSDTPKPYFGSTITTVPPAAHKSNFSRARTSSMLSSTSSMSYVSNSAFDNAINLTSPGRDTDSNPIYPYTPGSPLYNPDKLRQELDLEQSENQNLERHLRDSRKKLNSALEVQSQLELDVVDLAKQVSVLQNQNKELRKSKHGLENELSQEQMNYMNDKQQWLDKEAQSEKSITRLTDEVAKLKLSLEQQQKHEAELLSTISPPTPSSFTFPKFGKSSTDGTEVSSPTNSTFSGGHRRLLSIHSLTSANPQASTAAKDRTIDRLKTELDLMQQQTEMVSREYSLRHEQIETELQQTKALVSRLMEENEGFQFLLAEKAILGGFVADSAEASLYTSNDMTRSDSLADELYRMAQETQSSNTSLDTTNTNEHPNDINNEDNDNEIIDDTVTETIEHGRGPSPVPIKNPDLAQMKKRVYELEFESKTLKNHNKALTLSLERLVQRLLEFREFEQVLETNTMSGNINSKSISTFQNRISASAASITSSSIFTPSNKRMHASDKASIMSDKTGMDTVPFRRGHASKDSVSSMFSMPGSFSGVGPRSRPIKNPTTWTSMILGGSGGPLSSTASGSPSSSASNLAIDSDDCLSSLPPMASSPTSNSTMVSNSAAVMSSASSISSSDEQHINALINSSHITRRPSTNSQKKLRPLTMTSN